MHIYISIRLPSEADFATQPSGASNRMSGGAEPTMAM